MTTMEDTIAAEEGTPNLALETPAPGVFIPPSVHREVLLTGDSYTHFSPVPPSLLPETTADSSAEASATTTTADEKSPTLGPPCCLGVDEAGRGPVLGPMVYGVFYLPIAVADDLLKTTHHFDDSKVLTPATRSALMAALCTPGSDLHEACGWAVSSLGARAIGTGMLSASPASSFNLNAQALDATLALIRGVLDRGVNVREVYVDTVGPPATHQARIQRAFPGLSITVAKKADSLYPCVSAASVAAKVTRDAALEVLYEARAAADSEDVAAEEEEEQEAGDKKRRKTSAGKGGKKAGKKDDDKEEMAWGSGYPSDARCVNWLRRNMHPVFGWGPECRFSWGTVKDMLEGKGGIKVEWPLPEDEEGTSRLTDFFVEGGRDKDASDELGSWFGTPAGLEAF